MGPGRAKKSSHVILQLELLASIFLMFLSFITEEDDKLALLNLLAGYLSLLGEYISHRVQPAISHCSHLLLKM